MGVDTVADMLTKIRNANQAHHRFLTLPFSTFNMRIAQVLESEEFIYRHRVIRGASNRVVILLVLTSTDAKPRISEIKRISKPSCRVYARAKKIPKILGGYGTVVISTSRGLLTDKVARFKEGGEILFSIW
jgi:small subunit ribosomal protein S8